MSALNKCIYIFTTGARCGHTCNVKTHGSRHCHKHYSAVAEQQWLRAIKRLQVARIKMRTRIRHKSKRLFLSHTELYQDLIDLILVT